MFNFITKGRLRKILKEVRREIELETDREVKSLRGEIKHLKADLEISKMKPVVKTVKIEGGSTEYQVTFPYNNGGEIKYHTMTCETLNDAKSVAERWKEKPFNPSILIDSFYYGPDGFGGYCFYRRDVREGK